MEITRKQAIEVLQNHHMWTGEPQEIIDVKLENAALDCAISSLKADEYFDLLYEGDTIFYTQAEVIDILEKLIQKIDEMPSEIAQDGGRMVKRERVKKLIEERIKELNNEQTTT